MITKKVKHNYKPVSNREPASVVWEGAEYQRIMPGKYRAVATKVQGPEWLRRYHRWSTLVEFELLGDEETVRVCAFFNMGNDRNQPKAGRHSRYFRAWTIANGQTPSKGQVMTPEVFLEGQIFEIEVGDSGNDPDEAPKTDSEAYSCVTKICSADRPRS